MESVACGWHRWIAPRRGRSGNTRLSDLAVLWVAMAALPNVQCTLEVWATEEKVWREELRPAASHASRLWDPQQRTIALQGGRNEVVSFGLVLQAEHVPAIGVSVDFPGLPGLRARNMSAPRTDGSELFDWRSIEVELFYVRYLQIRGIGKAYTYDERLLPSRMQRPWTAGHAGAGVGEGSWEDRPGALKHWPEIAVPLELHPRFNISTNTSQMIWVDIYIPRGACPGERSGPLRILWTSGEFEVNVSLRIRRFTLPDMPTSKTMLPYEGGDILRRYYGQNWVHCSLQHTTRALFDRHYQLAWRHKVAMVSGSFDACVAEEAPKHDEPHPFDVARLNGQLFTAAWNYSGPGQGVGVGIFPVGLYGSWRRYWESEGLAGMKLHAERWRDWFRHAGAPLNWTELFLYLIDESHNYSQTEMWARWAQGSGLRSMATLPMPRAMQFVPSLDIACSTLGFASTMHWEAALANASRQGRPELWMYNGGRPAAGGFSIEEEASAPRSIPWAMYKKRIARYFYWMSTYYTNYQAGEGGVDVFSRAQTFGRIDVTNDPQKGETGWMYGNGDGVLMYPGTDLEFPESSYGVPGPFAGLRLKYWRRGLQDVEYLEILRKSHGEAKVDAILRKMVPKVLWEVDVPDPNDPSWARTNTSWPEAWEEWEKVRFEIADLIEEEEPFEPSCVPQPPEADEREESESCHETGGALEWHVLGQSSLRAWVTEEKVLREEHWADCSAARTRSSLWNGSAVRLFGARNEVVSFSLVLEAGHTGGGAHDIRVSLPRLGELRARPHPASDDLSDALFDWRATEIELFYVRYLQIRGLSGSYGDERMWPTRMQRPYMAAAGGGGLSSAGWKARPGADKHYPEIAVPLELHPSFNISAGESQMIWVDMYLPRDLPAGTRSGELEVRIGPDGNGQLHTVPILLTIHDFALPERPSAKTMIPIEGGDVLRRFIGQNWVHCSKQSNEEMRRLWERHWQVAWRHKVHMVAGSFDECKNYLHYMGLIEGDLEVLKDTPEFLSVLRLNGSSFTSARNYSGPGENLSLELFPIGLYGSWSRRDWDKNASGADIGLEAGFTIHLGRWEDWFRAQAPEISSTERFLYLVDESHDYEQIEAWAAMINGVTGSGSSIPSMATLNLIDAVAQTPSLDITCSTLGFAPIAAWKAAVAEAERLGMRLWLYNGGRPAHGSTNTEGEATDWRSIPWAMRKHGIEVYFYWMSTYYSNYQAGEGATNVFRTAKTFGKHMENSSTNGEAGWMYGNGDGVLLYPGTDISFPQDSYGVWGPFASLRMKYWRRGLQDVEYLELFKQHCGEELMQSVLQRVVPTVLWEVGEANWFPDISWPQRWDAWEQVRQEMARGIESACARTKTTTTDMPVRRYAAGQCVQIPLKVAQKIRAMKCDGAGDP
mmetsp:Transcript_141648/g.369262  ORF Transcript_141648/g.369262 Transcript_141648/m.369262 type:complete len:1397 (-) Transcript_141648:77-4267(-)